MKFIALAAALFVTLPTAAQTRANPPASAIEAVVSSNSTAEERHRSLRSQIGAELDAANAFVSAYWQAVHPTGPPFIMPRVAFVRDEFGRALWQASRSLDGGGITLTFEGFDAAYEQRLADTFTAAKPFLDAIFGQPYQSGVVKVKNYDADIGDRDAVAGGIYLPDDGSGSPAILFAVYLAPETAVVNFIHCLALAYQGPALLGFDAWSEGFARAGTMQTVRLGGVPGGLNQGTIDQIIESSYDNSPHYSWYNQPPLGNPTFIAPNLRNLPLPPGGSLGGIYLMRYKMGGTSWGKMLTEYPGFFATFLADYYAAFDIDPGIAEDIAELKSLAQSTMNTLGGGPGATVEGRSFANWHRRQYILDTTVTRGRKVFIEPIPITSGLVGNDFGVFAFWGTYFETLADGNETLLSGTSYPIYWDTSFARMFTSGQDDRMDIGAGFGSVTPNLPNVLGGEVWYRGTVELPVSDTIARSLVPVGAIATANNPTPKEFYGTVLGFDGAVTGGDPNVTGIVRLTLPAQAPVDAQLRNGAFGASVPAPGFNSPKKATVQVIRVVNSVETVLHTLFVNTWGQALGLDIRMDDETTYFPFGGLPGGIQMASFPVRPFETDMAVTVGQPPGQALIGRWRQDLFRYALYPSLQGFDYGRGFFIRLPVAQPGIAIEGLAPGQAPLSVALQVGWNQIGNPFPDDIPLTQVTVQRAAELPKLWSEAITAGWIDTSIFEFVPGAPDPFSGLPEGGAMNAITSFPAGKALFVRSLVAEGVTITFKPNTSMARSQVRAAEPAWRTRLSFTGLGVERSAVEIGAQSRATVGHDVGIDSLLPPLWGGALQASISGAAPMYRDMRASGYVPWTIVADGLRVGAVYEVRFERVAGRSTPRFRVRDVESGVSVSPGIGSVYRFTARAARHTFQVTAFTLSGGLR